MTPEILLCNGKKWFASKIDNWKYGCSSYKKNKEPQTFHRVLVARLGGLTCRYIGRHGEEHDIYANFTETYTSTPPVWFADNGDPCITRAVQILNNTTFWNQ